MGRKKEKLILEEARGAVDALGKDFVLLSIEDAGATGEDYTGAVSVLA